MDSAGGYIIPFKGLKIGSHPFDYEIDSKFFEAFPESYVHDATVHVHVDCEKEERMLVLHFTLDGEAKVPCDRCNGPMNVKINGKERLIVKFGETYQEQSDEVLIIPELEHQIDLAPFLYEYVHLLIPMRKVHEEDAKGPVECDPDVIMKMNELNQKTAIDPRWEALASLKEKNRKP